MKTPGGGLVYKRVSKEPNDLHCQGRYDQHEGNHGLPWRAEHYNARLQIARA